MKYPNPKDYYDEFGRLDLKEYDEEVRQFETAREDRFEFERDQAHCITETQSHKVDYARGAR